jgi:hypothetical protein
MMMADEDSHLHTHRRQNLKSHFAQIFNRFRFEYKFNE